VEHFNFLDSLDLKTVSIGGALIVIFLMKPIINSIVIPYLKRFLRMNEKERRAKNDDITRIADSVQIAFNVNQKIGVLLEFAKKIEQTVNEMRTELQNQGKEISNIKGRRKIEE